MILLCSLLSAVQAEKPDETKRLGVPMDAVRLCLVDVEAMGESSVYCRYVWCPENDPVKCGIVDVAVNTAVSRSPMPVKGVRIGENRLLRYDLRILAPEGGDLKLLTELWERFAEDEPYFLVNSAAVPVEIFEDVITITSENASAMNAEKVFGKIAKGTVFNLLDEHTDKNGDWYKIEYQGQEAFVEQKHAKKESRKVKQAEQSKATRALGPHCGQEALGLASLTGSQVPIVRYDYFVRKILSTLDGGLYYEFRGIVGSPDAAVSDIDNFLQTFAGVTEADVSKLRSDQKVAMLRSGVTGKPRAVLLFNGAQGRVTVNQGLVVLTQDMSDADVDPKADPLQNLLKHKFPGIELFLELPNGMIAYGLFTGDVDGDGKYDPTKKEGDLVRVVPDNIATDHAIPPPHTGRLQPAISCIRCHNQKRGNQQPENWIDLPNDVSTLLKSGLDVFGEKTDGVPKQDTIDRGAGLYTGDFDKTLRRARDDFAEAMLRLTGETGTDEETGVTVTNRNLVKTYHDYWYEMVTPQTACRELGFETAPDGAVAMLKKLLPPLPHDEIGVSPEDLRIGALKAGLSINRFQWEAVYADAAYRTISTLLETK